MTARPPEVSSEVCKFIPKLNQLKERAFTKLIPKPKTLRSAACFKKPELVDIPAFFSIVADDATSEILQRLADAQQAGNSPQKRMAGRKSRIAKKGKNQFMEVCDESRSNSILQSEHGDGELIHTLRLFLLSSLKESYLVLTMTSSHFVFMRQKAISSNLLSLESARIQISSVTSVCGSRSA